MPELRFAPVLLIGLGDYGAEIGQELTRLLLLKDPALRNIISCFALHNSGEFFTDESNTAVFSVEGLISDPAEVGVYQSNYNKLCAAEKTIENELLRCINRIQNKAVLDRLESAGYEIGDRVRIVFFSTLFDPVGSSAIIPMVGFLESLRSGLLGGLRMGKELFAFFPDLFTAERASEWAYCRSYACLQELDSVTERPDLVSYESFSPFNFMWLLTGKNEQGVDIGTYKDLTPMLSEVLWSLLSGQIGSDVSFSRVLAEKKDGQVKRYSSLGLSQLHYPRERILEALTDYVSMATLETHKLIEPAIYESDLMAAVVKDFIIGARLDRVLEELSVNPDGTTIWHDFSYRSRISENLFANDFLAEIREDALDFDKSELTGSVKRMAQRRDTLMQEQRKKLLSTLEISLDRAGEGLGYCQSFLDYLLGQPSTHTKGESLDKGYNLTLLERDTQSYFDELLKVHMPLVPVEVPEDVSFAELEENSPDADSNDTAGSTTMPTDEGTAPRIGSSETEEETPEETSEVKARERALKFKDAKANPIIRQKLLEVLENATKNEIDETSRKLADADDKYNDSKRNLQIAKENRERGIRNYFLLFPLLLTILYFVIWLVQRLFTGAPLLDSMFLSLKVFPAPLVIYFVWAAVKFLAIQHQLNVARSQYQLWKTQKIALCHRVQTLYNQLLHTRYEYSMQWGLVAWVDEYHNYCAEAATRVNGFQEGLSELYRNAKQRWQDFAFPDQLFIKSVVDKSHLERFINDSATLKSEIGRVFVKQPLSGFFRSFWDVGTLDSLSKALAGLVNEVFQDIRTQTIEDFIRKEAQVKSLNAERVLTQLVETTKAFILLNVERGQDSSESVVYLGVDNSSTSFVKEVFDRQGLSSLQYYNAKSMDVIAMTHLKVGFPAFYIGLVKHGARLLANKPGSSSLYINPQWKMKDLIPSQLTLGNSDDPIRRILCLGKALNLISESEQGLSYHDTILAPNMTELIELLRSFRGIDLRKKLEEAINQDKKGANALDRLVDYLERNREQLDAVETTILEEVITDLNPLG